MELYFVLCISKLHMFYAKHVITTYVSIETFVINSKFHSESLTSKYYF